MVNKGGSNVLPSYNNSVFIYCYVFIYIWKYLFILDYAQLFPKKI